MKSIGCAAAVSVAVGSLLATPAWADDAMHAPAGPPRADEAAVDLSYLFDGGMVPFFWAPLAGTLALQHWVTPPATPRMFSPSEGGAPVASWQVPSLAVGGLAVGVGAAMYASGDRSRLYHVKGLAESLMTSGLLTSGLKLTFGRHRPDYVATNGSIDGQLAFPSGHATVALAAATYSILYLRGHVFDAHRGSATLPWWEAATYVGIGAAATALAAERVIHNRHDLLDVAVGSAIGITSSALFYWYQERRYDDHVHREGIRNFVIAPSITRETQTVGLSFEW